MSSNASKVIAIIPAAGIGSRMGEAVPKQYLKINGKPILQHTIERLAGYRLIDGIIIALAEDDTYFKKLELNLDIPINTVVGGDERIHSVYNAARSLQTAVDNDDFFLVHDSVRPCVSFDDVDRLLIAAKQHPCGGLLATPVTDTIKRMDQEHEVSETVDRENLWRALTPQVFRAAMLTQALKVRVHDYIHSVTDEASVMETQGHKPMIVEGRSDNIKITHTEDLKYAEIILSQ